MINSGDKKQKEPSILEDEEKVEDKEKTSSKPKAEKKAGASQLIYQMFATSEYILVLSIPFSLLSRFRPDDFNVTRTALTAMAARLPQ